MATMESHFLPSKSGFAGKIRVSICKSNHFLHLRTLFSPGRAAIESNKCLECRQSVHSVYRIGILQDSDSLEKFLHEPGVVRWTNQWIFTVSLLCLCCVNIGRSVGSWITPKNIFGRIKIRIPFPSSNTAISIFLFFSRWENRKNTTLFAGDVWKSIQYCTGTSRRMQPYGFWNWIELPQSKTIHTHEVAIRLYPMFIKEIN